MSCAQTFFNHPYVPICFKPLGGSNATLHSLSRTDTQLHYHKSLWLLNLVASNCFAGKLKKKVIIIREWALTNQVVTVSISALSLADTAQILLVSQTLEDLHHGVSDGVDDLVVVVVEGHFNIQTHKLSQVTVGVGILSPENWSHTQSISTSKVAGSHGISGATWNQNQPLPFLSTTVAATRTASGVRSNLPQAELAT